jgi:3-phenylpropionate/cinnamic acid dioxygenase small subunit
MRPEPTQEALQQLLDKDAIKDTLYDYAYYLDMNYTEELAQLFTDDCYIAYGPGFGAEGIDAYRETLQGVGTFFTGTSHHVSNIKIDFEDENTARVRSVLLAWHRYQRERADGYVLGQYHDVMVRTPEGWRFNRRELQHAGTIDFHTKPEHQTMIARRS